MLNNVEAIQNQNKNLAKVMCDLASDSLNWGGLVSQWHLGKFIKIA